VTPRATLAPERLYETGLLEEVGGGVLRPGGLALTARALALCALPPRARVLDLGCGNGATVGHLRHGHGARAVGLDRSRARLPRGPGAAPFALADAAVLPVRTASLDAVVMECCLSALARPEAALAECRRVLAPGGALIVTDLYRRPPDGARGDRDDTGAPAPPALPSRGDVVGGVADQGFELLRWEDHSRALAELAARLVLTHGSLAPLGDPCRTAPGVLAALRERARGGRPGYFLLLAGKPARPAGGDRRGGALR
jgi:SAM-dependent methyltransferase